MEEQAQMYRVEEKREFTLVGGLSVAEYVEVEKSNHHQRQKEEALRKNVKKCDDSKTKSFICK